jgi:hypothetical protein
MRCDARVLTPVATAAPAFAAVAFALAALALAAAPAPASAETVMTDVYTVSAPRSPWKRVQPFDQSGQAAFEVPAKPGEPMSRIALSFEAATGRTPMQAAATLLDSERRVMRGETDGREGVERSSFRADSMTAGGLVWRGFRVDVRTSAQRGTSWRWVAIHPDFPRRQRAYRLAFDEYVSTKSAPASSRLADARSFAQGVKPRGKGWTAPLAQGFGDARVATFAARIDSAMRLCWSEDPEASPALRALGYGPGLALEGDFFELAPFAPKDSLVDANAAEYGTVFDRNADGRCDLILVNRGVQSYEGARLLPIVVAVADDDFDGRLDGAILENADEDGDGKADHRLWVHDSNGDGSADQAILFRDAVDAPGAKKLPVKDGVIKIRLAGQVAPALTFDEVLGPESERLPRLDQARSKCTLVAPGDAAEDAQGR